MELGRLYQWLDSCGWVKDDADACENCVDVWHRQYPDVRPSCFINGNGVEVKLTCFESNTLYFFEIELTAEAGHGTWVQLMARWIVPSELQEKLDRLVAGLIRAWKAVQ